MHPILKVHWNFSITLFSLFSQEIKALFYGTYFFFSQSFLKACKKFEMISCVPPKYYYFLFNSKSPQNIKRVTIFKITPASIKVQKDQHILAILFIGGICIQQYQMYNKLNSCYVDLRAILSILFRNYMTIIGWRNNLIVT